MDDISDAKAGQKPEELRSTKDTTSLGSDAYPVGKSGETTVPGWRKLAAVAGASAILGGLAAAWWYRGTLLKLRQAEESNANPYFGTSKIDPSEDDD